MTASTWILVFLIAAFQADGTIKYEQWQHPARNNSEAQCDELKRVQMQFNSPPELRAVCLPIRALR